MLYLPPWYREHCEIGARVALDPLMFVDNYVIIEEAFINFVSSAANGAIAVRELATAKSSSLFVVYQEHSSYLQDPCNIDGFNPTLSSPRGHSLGQVSINPDFKFGRISAKHVFRVGSTPSLW